MAEISSTQHRSTVPYFSWMHSTVDMLNMGILAVMCAVLGKLKLGSQDWMKAIAIIPFILNEVHESRLAHSLDGWT